MLDLFGVHLSTRRAEKKNKEKKRKSAFWLEHARTGRCSARPAEQLGPQLGAGDAGTGEPLGVELS